MRFTIKISIIIVAIIIFDKLIGLAMTSLVDKQKNGTLYDVNYKVFIAKPEIVILGSSRANHHYKSNIIDSSLKGRTINYGVDGGNVFNSFIALREIFDHSSPKLVILDILPTDFFTTGAQDDLALYYNFLHKMHMSKEDFAMVSHFEQYKLMLNTYRYNNQIATIINGTKGKLADTSAIDGYSALSNEPRNFSTESYNFENFENASYNYLKKVDSLCRLHHTKLVLCSSPYYAGITSATIDSTIAYSKRNNIPYINYLNDTSSFKKQYFRDAAHLNDNGAIKFTYSLLERFKSIL